MSLKATLARARLVMERDAMLSRCRIERPTDRSFNPATGEYGSTDRTVVYAGKCSITSQGANRMGDVDGREMVQGTYVLALPWSSEDAHNVDVSDTVVMLDPERTFAVSSVDRSDSRKALYVTLVHQDRGTVTYG